MSERSRTEPLLIMLAASFVCYGIFTLVAVEQLAILLTQISDTVTSRNELRANYGGMFVLFGMFLFVAARTPRFQEPVYLATIVMMAGLALGRIVSIILDGIPNWFVNSALAAEIGLAALCYWRYRIVAHRQAQAAAT